ncbi:MAG: 50S ribosomal protein L7/L12 [Spirochaetales bacterium]|nr:50S ribosomal protein L7/L12 [Spirochaetales bacterium]
MTTEEILNAIAGMTVLEVSELVKAMEEKFGVSAAAPVAMVAGGAVAEAADEQTEFNVVFKGFADGSKIPVIKAVREVTGLGLKEAKEIVEGSDAVIKEGVSKEDAASVKEKLEAAGAVIEVK